MDRTLWSTGIKGETGWATRCGTALTSTDRKRKSNVLSSFVSCRYLRTNHHRTLAMDFERIIPTPVGAEIELVRRLKAWETSENAWNFRASGNQERGTYSFAFDTIGRFPVPIFRRLAELFPTLAFECDCIEECDESMGYGWFNTPDGGDDFVDGYDVPDGYWEMGEPIKRDTMAELRHRALVARITQTVREAHADDA